MTNQISIVLGAIIILLFLVDLILFGGGNTMFLLRKFAELIEWLAFWR